MIFRFIEAHKDQWPVRLLCAALAVSPAGYYAWRDRPASDRQQQHDALLVAIRAIHAEFKARYGSQYASDHYQLLLGKHGITCSMSRRADFWDNAPTESFFALLKKELVQDADFATPAEARVALVEYIEVFYNRKRRYSSLGYVSPAEYEQSE